MTTQAELIEALGGGSKVAEALAGIGHPVDRERVYTWKRQNHIARWARPLMRHLALKAGLSLPVEIMLPEDFEQPKGDAAAQATSA